MANARLHHLPFAVFLLTAVTAGCAAGDAPAARPPAENAQSTAAQRNPVETALLEAAGVQYHAYDELLAMFSNEGAAPLLSRQVDLGADDPKAAVAHYRRLIDLTDRMVAAEAAFQEAVKAMADQTGLPIPGKVTKQGTVGWNLQLLSLLPVMQTGLLQSDLLHSGWKFWKWGENARRSARATVLGVAFADAEQHRLQKPEQEMMRRRVYEVARTRYADQGNLGGSEREFFENLRDGKLDHIAQRLHADMSQDGSTEGMAYMTVAGMQGKRPIDVVYQEGCRGLAAGVDLYIAAGKAAVAGGLGPEAGEKFLEGYDKAVEIVEKIQEIESHAEELNDAVRDPIGYMQEKVPQMLKERAVELLQEKTGLSDEVIEECTDQLGEAVQQVVQHVEYSQRIDAAYEKEQFKAELAEAKTVQPPTGEDPPAADRPRVAVDGPRFRRITEQVHEEMAAEGWSLGAVSIELGAAADAASGAARSSLDGVVAWWQDASTQANRLTILPTPVASGTVMTLPAGTQVELLELADSGTIHRLTERPMTVLDEGITQVAVHPPAIELPAGEPSVGEPAVRDTRATPPPSEMPGMEQVLLSLPSDFDVKPPEMNVSGNHGGTIYVTDEPWVFRFRGEQVSGGARHTVKWDNGTEKGQSIHQYEVEGTFRRGFFRAEGTHAFTAGFVGKEPTAKSWTKLRLHGQANADGALSIEVEQFPIRYIYQARGEWKEHEEWAKNWPPEARKWGAPMVLQLPVGELQSSQQLSVPPADAPSR